MKRSNFLFLIVLVICSSVATANTVKKSNIEAVELLWSTSFAKNNIDGLMALYTEDAVMCPPSSEILNGKLEILGYLEGLKKVGVQGYNIFGINLNFKDNLAYKTGLWEVTRVDDQGNVIKLEGNITSVMERQDDGSWKIKFQSWN